MNTQRKSLSPYLRFYIYALHGVMIEVCFTAIWDLVEKRNWKLSGYTSIWCLLIYGSGGFFLEYLSDILKGKHFSIFSRGIIYLAVAYSFEFSFGFTLSMFSICPWDYTPFKYNYKGICTLEFAPFYLLLTLLAEYLIFDNLKKLEWREKSSSEVAKEKSQTKRNTRSNKTK